MIEPLLRGREAVFLLEQLDGRIVEGPHPFIRTRATIQMAL